MRVILFSLALGLSTSASAQQIIPVYEEPHHKFVHEEPGFRVLDVVIPEREETLDHSHEYDVATVCIECADTRIRDSGKPWGPLRLREPGITSVAIYAGKPGAHAILNVGKGAYRLIGVENRRLSGWSTARALDSQPGTTLKEEAHSFRVYDVRVEPGRAPVRHVHALPVVVVLYDGVAMAGSEPAKDAKHLAKPGQWVVYPAGTAHTLSAHGKEGAHLAEFEVR